MRDRQSVQNESEYRVHPTSHDLRRTPSQEAIARRAYEIYLSRGAQGGRPEEDWYQAERELQNVMR